jgi:hypothetical protein
VLALAGICGAISASEPTTTKAPMSLRLIVTVVRRSTGWPRPARHLSADSSQSSCAR